MALFVVAHGAWSAGWAWWKMHPLMRGRGHELVTPTYTGIGEREHLFSAAVDLETHITDMLNVLHYHDLADVVLIGHSYGGMVATGVADRARRRIRQLVYLDAFTPDDGDSVFDLAGSGERYRMSELAGNEHDGLRIPPNPMPPDTAKDDADWCLPRRVPQPLKTFEQKLVLQNGPLTLPIDYIYCTKIGPVDVFRQFAEKAASQPGWARHDLDASHNPHITVPDRLMDLLEGIAADRA